jgi:hypothetical protein
MNLLIPGIIVFVLMLIGIVYTVLEFKKMEREDVREEGRRTNLTRKE